MKYKIFVVIIFKIIPRIKSFPYTERVEMCRYIMSEDGFYVGVEYDRSTRFIGPYNIQTTRKLHLCNSVFITLLK